MSAKKKPAVAKKHNKGRRKIAQFPVALALDTVPDARKTWAKIIRLYNENKMSSAKARDNNSFFKTLLGYLLGEREQNLVERMTSFEMELAAIKAELKTERRLEVVKK